MRIRLLIAVLVTLALAATAPAATVTIQPGETLSHVASRYGMSVDALARQNGISDPHSVMSGTRLSVSGRSRLAGSTGGGGGHVVQPGESLGSIARRYGTSASALAAGNGISNPNMVVAGTRLRISRGGGWTSRSRASAGGSGGYVVQPGESLGSIAQRYGTSASALAAANGISDPNMVLAGTRLRISGRLAASSSGMTQGPLNPITAATHGWGAHPGKGEVSALISRYASRHGVDPSLVRAIGWQESGFWQGARSSTGAVGVMQLMPGTASWAGPALLGRQIDPHDVHDNVETGAAYIAYLQRQTGSRRLTIASYYQGWGSVSSRGLYGETESYVSSVSSFIGRV